MMFRLPTLVAAVPDIDRPGTNLSLDLTGFAPEAVALAGVLLLQACRVVPRLRSRHLGLPALGVCVTALALALLQWLNGRDLDVPFFFGGLLGYDGLSVLLRVLLFTAAAGTVWLTLVAGSVRAEDSGDWYALVLAATVGMCLMGAANHLLTAYLGLELLSVAAGAAAGLSRPDTGTGDEPATAFDGWLLSAVASGFMLYGMSLVSGRFGTGWVPDIAAGFAALLSPAGGGHLDPVLVLGCAFVFVGIAFKAGLVPFHAGILRLAGDTTPLAGFLSVAPVGAGLGLVARWLLVLAGLGERPPDTQILAHWERLAGEIGPVLAGVAGVTMTVGTLGAVWQTNLRRFLAYTTVAQAGLMLAAIATVTPDGVAAFLATFTVFVTSGLGAFGVLTFLRGPSGAGGVTTVADLAGLGRRSPWLALGLGVFLLGLTGMPPLAGFAGRAQIFLEVARSARTYAGVQNALSNSLSVLLVAGVVNTGVAALTACWLFAVMYFESAGEAAGEAGGPPRPTPRAGLVYTLGLAGPVLALGVGWWVLAGESRQGVDVFSVRAAGARPMVAQGYTSPAQPPGRRPTRTP